MGNFIVNLQARGFIKQMSHAAEIAELFSREKVTCYVGFDPTADSLHVGHLMPIFFAKHLQQAGHRPFFVVGGGTVMAGDPSGKEEMRGLMTVDEIATFKAGIRLQLERFLDFGEGQAMLLDNADWLLKLNYVQFLRDIGVHFSVNRMLQAECYKVRMSRPDAGLSFIELNYMILQSYDFLHLYRTYNCKLQFGGDDQWSNILSGADLIRRVDRGEAFALTLPLLETTDGKKMGKTEVGTVWLDPERTSPFEFYQFWRNTHDGDVINFLSLFTLLPMDEVLRWKSASGKELNNAKQLLAFQVTKLIHGEAAANLAQATALALFASGGDDSAMPTTFVSEEELKGGLLITEALVRTGLCSSNSDARRLIQGNGLTINGERPSNHEYRLTLDDLQDGKVTLRKGRKDYHALRLQAP